MVLVDHRRDVLTEYLKMYSDNGEQLVNDFLIQAYDLTLIEVCADLVAQFKVQGLYPDIDNLSEIVDEIIADAFHDAMTEQ